MQNIQTITTAHYGHYNSSLSAFSNVDRTRLHTCSELTRNVFFNTIITYKQK